ncbi:hypothetical protein QWR20_000308 [Vibrio fluvialis]|nr:hypothetical protein [Vibrio fluvialis]
MVLRSYAAKRTRIPKQTLTGNCDDSVLVMSWGGTLGSVATAIAHLRERGAAVAHVHLRYLNPFPANLETIIKHFDHVLVFELNNQQLVKVIRSQFGIAARSVTQVNGLPFKVRDVADAIEHYLEEINRGEE